MPFLDSAPHVAQRDRLAADLLEAARVLTEPARPGWTDSHRLGALDMLVLRAAHHAGLPDVADEINDMLRARHERVMAGFRESATLRRQAEAMA